MSPPVEFEDVVPVVPVRDLHATLDRYRRLGFTVRAYGHGTGYGYADRGHVSIHISEWNQHDPQRTGWAIYLYVSDTGAVRAEWVAAGVEGRFGDIQDTDYGMREFPFVDPDGTLHRVGSRLRQDDASLPTRQGAADAVAQRGSRHINRDNATTPPL